MRLRAFVFLDTTRSPTCRNWTSWNLNPPSQMNTIKSTICVSFCRRATSMIAMLRAWTIAVCANAMTCRTAVLTFAGQALGSAQRFERGFMLTTSSDRTLPRLKPKQIITN